MPFVTLQLLWQEYKESCPEAYQYSRFCELYAGEQIPQRSVHAIADKTLDAGGMAALPLRVDGECNFGRPSGDSAARQQDELADGFHLPLPHAATECDQVLNLG